MKELIRIFAILFILYMVWMIQKHNIIDNSVEFFANQFYENHHPDQIINRGTKCPNRLYKENNKYYLVNTNRPIVLNKNPKKFDSYVDYLKYAKILQNKHSCPIIDITNIENKVVKHNNPEDDPLETYQKRCNKKIAEETHKYLNEIPSQEILTVTSQHNCNNDKMDYHKNYDVETCMKALYLSEHDGIMATPL